MIKTKKYFISILLVILSIIILWWTTSSCLQTQVLAESNTSGHLDADLHAQTRLSSNTSAEPVITVFTPGLGSAASVWSNDSTATLQYTFF